MQLVVVMVLGSHMTNHHHHDHHHHHHHHEDSLEQSHYDLMGDGLDQKLDLNIDHGQQILVHLVIIMMMMTMIMMMMMMISMMVIMMDVYHPQLQLQVIIPCNCNYRQSYMEIH